jgi:hypothetical protein
MPITPTVTAYTVSEINDMMTAAFASTGSRQADADIERAMRRPNSSIYFQRYLEARCVIRTLVELGLSDVIANVGRQLPPMPDVRVDFTQGGAAFNVEGAVRALVHDVGIGPFDRLVVQCPRRSPLVPS